MEKQLNLIKDLMAAEVERRDQLSLAINIRRHTVLEMGAYIRSMKDTIKHFHRMGKNPSRIYGMMEHARGDYKMHFETMATLKTLYKDAADKAYIFSKVIETLENANER